VAPRPDRSGCPPDPPGALPSSAAAGTKPGQDDRCTGTGGVPASVSSCGSDRAGPPSPGSGRKRRGRRRLRRGRAVQPARDVRQPGLRKFTNVGGRSPIMNRVFHHTAVPREADGVGSWSLRKISTGDERCWPGRPAGTTAPAFVLPGSRPPISRTSVGSATTMTPPRTSIVRDATRGTPLTVPDGHWSDQGPPVSGPGVLLTA
jgi:hypothetical protein